MESTLGHDLYKPRYTHESERNFDLECGRKYYRTKQEQVKLFEKLIVPYLAGHENITVLDAACGLGDLTYFLSQANPGARFVGIDIAGFLLEEARGYFNGNPNVSFEEVDIHSLSQVFAPTSFDVAVCKQTLSWLPSYEDAIRELMAVTRGPIFASSLFYDGRIDFNIRVREYETEVGKEGYNAYYNIYSLPVFREFCMAQGAKDVVATDFNIEIDLPMPESLDRMATRTVRLGDGERLQISGALLMPWKIVRIDQ